MSLTTFFQALVSGVLVGCLYALIGLGFSLIFGVTRALNLAHGDMLVLGGYAGYALWLGLGVPPLLLIPVAAAATLPLAFVWHWLIARLPAPIELSSCVATFGLSLLLQTVMTGFWSGEYRVITSPALAQSVDVAGVVVNHGRVFAAIIAVMLILALSVALARVRWGRAVRAVSVDRDAAALVGINPERSTLLAFLLAMALAGGGGLLFATIHYLHPTAGTDLTLLAVVLTMWAGIGRVGGMLAAGVVIGVVETLTVALVGSGWRDVTIALLLIGSLLARGGTLTRSLVH